MNNLLAQSQSRDFDVQPSRQVKPSLKLIVFTLGNLNFGLRIESVYKVVERTPVYSSGLNHVGVAHMSDSRPFRKSYSSRTSMRYAHAPQTANTELENSTSSEVTVVDLNWQFFKSSSISDSSGYLVIVQNTTGEFYGIPVAKTPALMEVPLSMFRVLPEAYRRADTLEVASHVAVIPHEGLRLTVFLLDVELLLPMFQELAVV